MMGVSLLWIRLSVLLIAVVSRVVGVIEGTNVLDIVSSLASSSIETSSPGRSVCI